MRFSKSSVKTHIVRGATSKQAKSRSVQKAGPSCEKNSFYWCKNHSDNFLWFFSDSCSKGFQNGLKLRSQPLQSKEIKYLQKFDSKGLPKGYQAVNGFLAKLQKQVPLFK